VETKTRIVEWKKSPNGIDDGSMVKLVKIDSTHIPTLSEIQHINAKEYSLIDFSP
jgi:hypothetical protein